VEYITGGRSAIQLYVNDGGRIVDISDHLVEQDRHTLDRGWQTPEVTATFVDLDGDGDLDIYADAFVFENQGPDPATLEGVAGVATSADANGVLDLTVRGVASGSVAIDVSLGRDGEVALTVFDVQGRRVRRLVDGRLQAGDRVVHWDGRDDAGHRMAPGRYFVHLSMDGHAIAAPATWLH
jgi:hypothetical protein